jgi:hypothetical protein
MESTYIKAVTRLQDKIALLSSLAEFPSEEHLTRSRTDST